MKMVKYNKHLQKRIDINLIYYKFYSKKYIEYQIKNKGKEFDYNDNLLYEGEFFNGERNGKGKEYEFEKLVFEGEYLNGKRNGYGKEYNGYAEFEGEYLNGERWTGKIKIIDDEEGGFILYMEEIDVKYLNGENFYKITDINGKIIQDLTNYNGLVKEYYEDNWLKFQGEFLNGKRNGKGKEYNYRTGELEFEGEYLNGKKNGKGKEYITIDIEHEGKIWGRRGRRIDRRYKKGREYDSKIIFEGEYLNGKRWNGKGIEINNANDLLFEGEYLNGERWNGKGEEYIETKNRYILFYEGEYLNGKKVNSEKQFFLKNGHNKEYDGDNLIFEGDFINCKRCGKGIEYDNKGRILFEGEYLNDFRLKGKKYIDGRLEYEGEYLWNKKWNGKGYDENGNKIYEIKNGTGKAKEFDEEGQLIFDGEYLNGKKWNGKIKKYYEKNLIFEGTYLNGKITGKGKEYNHYTGELEFEGEYLNGKKWNGIEKIIEDNSDDDYSYTIIKGKYVEGKYERVYDVE